MADLEGLLRAAALAETRGSLLTMKPEELRQIASAFETLEAEIKAQSLKLDDATKNMAELQERSDEYVLASQRADAHLKGQIKELESRLHDAERQAEYNGEAARSVALRLADAECRLGKISQLVDGCGSPEYNYWPELKEIGKIARGETAVEKSHRCPMCSTPINEVEDCPKCGYPESGVETSSPNSDEPGDGLGIWRHNT